MNTVIHEVKDNIHWVLINRPKERNALNISVLKKFCNILDEVENSSAKCLVITSCADEFCTGADLVEWSEAESSGELDSYGWSKTAHQVLSRLLSLSKPSIAAINGSIVGAGLDLAMCCDLRFAAQSAKFNSGYTRVGCQPDEDLQWREKEYTGSEEIKEFLYFNETWSASRAQEENLVSDVFDDEMLLDEVEMIAGKLVRDLEPEPYAM